MSWFYLQPLSLIAFSQAILSGAIAVYLVVASDRSRSTRMLAIALSAHCVQWIIAFLFSGMVSGSAEREVFDALDNMAGPVVIFGFVHFAYAFHSNPFRKESRIVFWITIGVILFSFASNGFRAATGESFTPFDESVIEVSNLFFILWTAMVFFRKKARLSVGRVAAFKFLRATTREERALRAFAFLMLMITPLAARSVWVSLFPAPTWANSFLFVGFVAVLISFVIVYINYSPQPTSFLAKVVGLTLATILVILGLIPIAAFPEVETAAASRSSIPELQDLRFVPEIGGGFRMVETELPIDTIESRSLDLAVEMDTLVQLPFELPFAGQIWTSLFVDSNGLVSFGSPYRSPRFLDFSGDPSPKIVPYYRAIVPSASALSGVFVGLDSTKVVVTWRDVMERYDAQRDNRNTFQLVADQDGVIDFRYDRMEAVPWYGVRGLVAGERGHSRFEFFTGSDTSAIERIIRSDHSIVFEPDTSKRYRVFDKDVLFVEDLGEQLRLANGEATVLKIPFQFPFFSASWDSVAIHDNGILTFGRTLYDEGSLWYNPFDTVYASVPMIATLFDDLDPSRQGEIWTNAKQDVFTVTWVDVPRFGYDDPNTFQASLHADGSITFVYKEIGLDVPAADLWGLYSGRSQSQVGLSEYQLYRSSVSIPDSTTFLHDFSVSSRNSYLEYRHAQMIPFFRAIILSTLFVLLFFPLAFRTSLVRPLKQLLAGVRDVEKGSLDTRIPVQSADEFGILAANFNSMTDSLRSANIQLKSYATSLEQKVEERTIDLQLALDNLKETRNQLIQAEKMASLGQLTAGIAHEIKNPLNFVTNFSEMSVDLVDELGILLPKLELSDGDLATEFETVLADLRINASKISEHSARADGIVTNMLEHSRHGPGERRRVDIHGLVDEFIKLAEHGRQLADLTIQRDYDPQLVGIDLEVDPQALGRVFTNLINNAADAIESRREADKEAPGIIKVMTRGNHESIEISISDSGDGIPPDEMNKIFEPFYTTKPTGKGTGLGLSLSYDIVTLGHGGSLAASNSPEGGAIFTIVLPIQGNAATDSTQDVKDS